MTLSPQERAERRAGFLKVRDRGALPPPDLREQAYRRTATYRQARRRRLGRIVTIVALLLLGVAFLLWGSR